MKKSFNWLIKKTPRSVDQLRLWPENPRLNPDEVHLTLNDFADDLTHNEADKKDFYDLITSIVEDGFIPADPVVVWQNKENKKYYVAEGNRRLVALKLLRDPNKAPKRIRSFIKKSSNKMDLTTIEKIPVNVAPSFEEAEWYINQRNSSSSLQRRWSRVQQQRWIVTLYDKHNGDIDQIISITKLKKADLEGFIRILKIKDFVKLDAVKTKLTDEEFELANSYRFPITILERFFNFSIVKEKWGIEYDGLDVKINSVKTSFYNAFAELVKRMVANDETKINTRFSKDDLPNMLDELPKVVFSESESGSTESIDLNTPASELDGNTSKENSSSSEEPNQPEESSTPTQPINKPQYKKNDPKRARLILSIFSLNSTNFRLAGLFEELKKIPHSYKNSIAASLRLFLDLTILEYIQVEGIESNLTSTYSSSLKDIPLKKRLEYIKSNHLTGNPKEQKIVSRLIDPSTQYSLDVLNGYIHGNDTHYLNKQFLNSFWDFLFPLFEFLLDIDENA